MNEGTHTPGPWIVDPDFICDVKAGPLKISTAWSCDEAGKRLLVADVPMPDPDEQEANARLIASAPCLLEAGHTLAMLAIQSDRYHDETDFKIAVDNMLCIVTKATQPNPPQH